MGQDWQFVSRASAHETQEVLGLIAEALWNAPVVEEKPNGKIAQELQIRKMPQECPLLSHLERYWEGNHHVPGCCQIPNESLLGIEDQDPLPDCPDTH